MSGQERLVISKADGSTERYSETKLRRCLQLVLRAAGHDLSLVEPLARAVSMHLTEWESDSPPTSDYVFRCVRAVLRQTELAAAAEVLESHRRTRRAVRKRLRVFDPVRSERGLVAWKKAAIAEALENKFGLQRPAARVLAAELEARVMTLGYRVVRTTLLHELVQNELMSWGLVDGLAVGVQAELWSKPVGVRWPARED